MIVRAITPIDRLDDDGESLLLFEGRVVKLGPVGAAIIEVAAGPVDVDVLTSELERRLGSPATGDVAAATAQAVADLLEAGVLERLDPDPTQASQEPT